MKYKKHDIKKINIIRFLILVIVMWAASGCSHNDYDIAKENDSAKLIGIHTDVFEYLKYINITQSTLKECPRYEDLIKEINIESKELEVKVSEQEVQKYVDNVVESYSKLKKLKDRKIVKKGDFVKIKFKTFYKGKLVSDMDNEVVKVGAGKYDKNLEKVLEGLRVGNKYVKQLTVPQNDINSEMAGKKVKIKIWIKSINRYLIPELTDKFVQEKLGYNSVKELYKEKREIAENEKKLVKYTDELNLLTRKIAEKCHYDIDVNEVATYATKQVNYYEQLAYIQNLTLEKYATSNNMTLDELYQLCYDEKEQEIKKILLVGYLGKYLNVDTLDSNEYINMNVEEKYSIVESKVVEKFIR